MPAMPRTVLGRGDREIKVLSHRWLNLFMVRYLDNLMETLYLMIRYLIIIMENAEWRTIISM